MKKRLFMGLLLLAVAIGLTVGLGLQYERERENLATAKATAARAAEENRTLITERDDAQNRQQALSPAEQAEQQIYKEWQQWHSKLEQTLGQ